MSKTVILLCGSAGSGKDTSYEMLKKLWDVDNCVMSYSFGRPLKEIVVDLCRLFYNAQFSAESMNNLEYKEVKRPEQLMYLGGEAHPLVLRTLLQQVGTDILRKQLGDDIFAKAVIQNIAEQMSQPSPQIAIITDLRFPNEQKCIMDYCFQNGYKCMTVFIHRSNVLQSHGHSSESYYNSLEKDIIVDNNGTLLDLERELKKIQL